MKRVLEKMAKQLNQYDEASLMQFWPHYASLIHDFEPTGRWEEAAVVLCLIQAVHWKNQLFNYHLATSATPFDKASLPPLPELFGARRSQGKGAATAAANSKPKATILPFPEKNKNSPASAAGRDTGSGADGTIGVTASHSEERPESER
jgi:hypothetical protein